MANNEVVKIKLNSYNIIYRNEPEFTLIDMMQILKGKIWTLDDNVYIINLIQLCICYDEISNVYKIHMGDNCEPLVNRNALMIYHFKRKNLNDKLSDFDIIPLNNFLNELYNGKKIKYYLSSNSNEENSSDNENGIVYRQTVPKYAQKHTSSEKDDITTFNNLIIKYCNICSNSNYKRYVNLKKMHKNINLEDKLILSRIIGEFETQHSFIKNMTTFIENPKYMPNINYEILSSRIKGNMNRETLLFLKK